MLYKKKTLLAASFIVSIIRSAPLQAETCTRQELQQDTNCSINNSTDNNSRIVYEKCSSNGATCNIAKKREPISDFHKYTRQSSAADFHSFDDQPLLCLQECKSIKSDKFKLKDCAKAVNGSQINKCYVISNTTPEVLTNIDVINAMKFIFSTQGMQYNNEVANIFTRFLAKSLLYKNYHTIIGLKYDIPRGSADISDFISSMAKSRGLTVEQFYQTLEQSNINRHTFAKYMREQKFFENIFSVFMRSSRVREDDICNEKRVLQNRDHGYSYEFAMIQEDSDYIDDLEVVARVLQNIHSSSCNILSISNAIFGSFVNEFAHQRPIWSIDKQTASILNNMQPYTMQYAHTNHIKNILLLFDKSNKCGDSWAEYEYNVISTAIHNKLSMLSSAKDKSEFHHGLAQIKNASTLDEFKAVCQLYGWKYTIETVKTSDANYRMIKYINDNNTDKKTVFMQADNSTNNIYHAILVSQCSKKAGSISNQELLLSAKRKKAVALLKIESAKVEAMYSKYHQLQKTSQLKDDSNRIHS